jgi:hypothetical protein
VVEFSAHFFKVKGLILSPLPGERKWQKEARYIMAGDSRRAVDFSARYFKVKGLNPSAYAWRKKMAERS